MKELIKEFDSLVGRHRKYTVFSDLCAVMALTIRNSVDRNNWKEREDNYLNIISKYNEKEIKVIARIFSLVILELEKGPRDVLGRMYMESEMGSKELGQFFTPEHVADLLSELTYDNEVMKEEIDKFGYVKLMEPAVGGGVTVISYVRRMIKAGYNPQKQLYVHATDVDLAAVHMTYIQLSLLGVPATIVHGNSLTLQTWDVWATPFYILEGFSEIKHKIKER